MMIANYDIFRLIEKFVPSVADIKNLHLSTDKFPFVQDTLNLLDSLLPEREDALKAEHEKPRLKLELDKKKFFLESEHSRILFIAEKILPRIFSVYENNI